MKRQVGNGFKGNPTEFTFPKSIKIKPSAAGLIVGEGYLGRSFIFCNSDEKIIKEILEFLSQFNKELNFVFEVSTKNMPKSFIENSKKKWETVTQKKIKKIRIRREFNNTTEKGNVHISLYNTLFPRILNKIIQKIKSLAERDKVIAKDYLKGILAAEGNINVKSTTTNCLYMVRISASKKEERDHYKRCLERIGIKIYCKDMPTISKEEGKQKGWKTTKGRAGAVLINRWENFVKILQFDLLDLHRDKKEKFNKHFLKNKFTKIFLELEPFIGKEFTMKEAQNYFNFSGRSLGRILTLYKKGYISRKKINKVKFGYKLTPKYLLLYDKLKSISSSPTSQ